MRLKCVFCIVMPCSCNPCIIPSVDLPMELFRSKELSVFDWANAWADSGQTLVSNADGGEGLV